jgi:putative transposase
LILHYRRAPEHVHPAPVDDAVTAKAADAFKDKTTSPNQLWQTEFTYLKVIGWGWFYLSTVLDDFSRYIVAWKLCTTMKAEA